MTVLQTTHGEEKNHPATDLNRHITLPPLLPICNEHFQDDKRLDRRHALEQKNKKKKKRKKARKANKNYSVSDCESSSPLLQTIIMHSLLSIL